MYRLEGYRVISGNQCWIPLGEFPSIEKLLGQVGRFYALDWRMVVIATGEIIPIEWKEDTEDADCVVPFIPSNIVDRLNGQKTLLG